MSVAGVATREGAYCHNVRKVYRVDRERVLALDAVTKEFRRGDFTVIAGPSGSGKSSLLRILACVDRPDGGSVEIAGHGVADASARRRRRLRRYSIAFIFADPVDNLVEYLTAADQVRLAARLRGVRATGQEVTEALARLGLADRADHIPHQLSGGEQQRVAIACAMVGGPPVVVADEPTAELDSVATGVVLDGFRVLADTGAAIAIASHDPRVIDRADSVLRLDHGRVSESW
ncbi:MAG: ATP-binding cassette domain-containing protein [Jatrophihabitans sp.]|nr:MAG: ATP-binding cassette domain-containing protein [Jatrophihabitans sp.]